MTNEQISQASIDEGKRIIQERLDAKQVTPEEKLARQTSLRTQIDAQHKTAVEAPTVAARIQKIREANAR